MKDSEIETTVKKAFDMLKKSGSLEIGPILKKEDAKEIQKRLGKELDSKYAVGISDDLENYYVSVFLRKDAIKPYGQK